jgi:hypothetical protein
MKGNANVTSAVPESCEERGETERDNNYVECA